LCSPLPLVAISFSTTIVAPDFQFPPPSVPLAPAAVSDSFEKALGFEVKLGLVTSVLVVITELLRRNIWLTNTLGLTNSMSILRGVSGRLRCAVVFFGLGMEVTLDAVVDESDETS